MANQTIPYSPAPRQLTVEQAKQALRLAAVSIDYWQSVRRHPLLAVSLAAAAGVAVGSKSPTLRRLPIPPAVLDIGLMVLRRFL